jgi:hypothetical protein
MSATAEANREMTGVELFRALKASGTGERHMRTVRRVLQEHKQAAVADLVADGVPASKAPAEAQPMSARKLLDSLTRLTDDKGKPVMSDVTLRKCSNILAGQHPDVGSRVKPEDWDDEIDGAWDGRVLPAPTQEEREARLANSKGVPMPTPAAEVLAPKPPASAEPKVGPAPHQTLPVGTAINPRGADLGPKPSPSKR